jgi:hypothetical protein
MKLKKLFKTAVSHKASKAVLTVGLVGVAGVVAAQTNVATDTIFASGDPFSDALDMVRGFTAGALGKIIASVMILGGLMAGIMRQSLWSAVIGVAAGLILALSPEIIDTVFDAAMPFMV